jgi:putative ABC transport system permease protein
MQRWPLVEQLAQDMGYTLRSLRRNRRFTITASLTLALGIGAGTATFNVVKAVVLNPLPFPRSRELVQLHFENPLERASGPFTLAEAEFVARGVRGLSHVAIAAELDSILGAPAESVYAQGLMISGNYFDTLGIPPNMGRFIEPADGLEHDHVIVLSRDLWRTYFHSAPDMLGRMVPLDGKPYRVIGVAGSQYAPPQDPQFWIPFEPQAHGSAPVYPLSRMSVGTNITAVNSELHALSLRLAQFFPDRKGWFCIATSVAEDRVGDRASKLKILACAVGLLFVVGCINVAGLLLSRVAMKEKELLIRVALGASRLRICRQVFLEGFWLAVIGAMCGLFVALALFRMIVNLGPRFVPSLNQRVYLDGGAFCFALILVLLTAILSTSAPAWLALYNGPGGRRSSFPTGGWHTVQRLGAWFVCLQLALTLILLTGGGLLLRSFINLMTTPLGYEPRNLLVLQVIRMLPEHAKEPAAVAPIQEVLTGLRKLPGVQRAAYVEPVPMNGGLFCRWHKPEDSNPASGASIAFTSPGFFDAMRIRLVEGRDFVDDDLHARPLPVIVNAPVARVSWPAQHAIGRALVLHLWEQAIPAVVVGVVSRTTAESLFHRPEAQIYAPINMPGSFISFVIRTRGSPQSMVSSVRKVVHDAGPNQAVVNITSMEDLIAGTLVSQRFYASLSIVLSVLALAIASVGLHALLSYLVIMRTREIGIRVAIGASPLHVVKLVLGFVMRTVASAVVLGLLGALAGARVLGSLLHGLSAYDPVTFTIVSLVLTAVTALACAEPLARILRTDPNLSLHEE